MEPRPATLKPDPLVDDQAFTKAMLLSFVMHTCWSCKSQLSSTSCNPRAITCPLLVLEGEVTASPCAGLCPPAGLLAHASHTFCLHVLSPLRHFPRQLMRDGHLFVVCLLCQAKLITSPSCLLIMGKEATLMLLMEFGCINNEARCSVKSIIRWRRGRPNLAAVLTNLEFRVQRDALERMCISFEMQQWTGETMISQTVIVLLCVMLQVDRCVNSSQLSAAVWLQVPNVVGDHANGFKFSTCSAGSRIRSVILVCLLSNADSFSNSTIVVAFSDDPKHDGRRRPPSLLEHRRGLHWRISQFNERSNKSWWEKATWSTMTHESWNTPTRSSLTDITGSAWLGTVVFLYVCVCY